MSEKNSFSNIQRRNSAVMAKHEWTSSLLNMQKSGHEIHDRRIKTHRKANEFLQGLLQKRSDGSLLDDNGIIDRYEKFLKYKSNFNDDDILNEFDRRLRALNKDRRHKRSIPMALNIPRETNYDVQSLKTTDRDRHHKGSIPMDLQISQETENDIKPLKATDRIKSVSKSTITSNNSPVSNISSNDNPADVRFSIDTYQSSSSSLTSSSIHSMAKPIHRPKARRADGTEVIVTPTRRTLRRASSNILIFNHCHFPRSLKPREQVNINVISEEQVPPSSTIEQYDHNQVFHLLDQIENECSPVHFATILDQLTLSTVQINQIDNNNNNLSFINNHENEYEENISIDPNLFNQSTLSQEYYKTLDINIDDPKKVLVYTMTIGIVQLSPSLTVPYSILNGRRPLLQSSVQTNFRKLHCKQPKHISQVTAIDSTENTELLQENDIILRIDDQSVWHLTTEAIRDILQQSNNCLLTVARLCQPFV